MQTTNEWLNFSNEELLAAFEFYDHAPRCNVGAKRLRSAIAEEVGERGGNVYALLDDPVARREFEAEVWVGGEHIRQPRR